MYVPPAFREEDLPVLQAFMEEHAFATFVSGGETPFVTHVPLLLDRARGSKGTLLGHVARANPHALLMDGARKATAVFHGPHAYVSPSWYDAGKPSVPTWNYAVVHASGVPRVTEDAAVTKAVLARMVEKYESGRAQPWAYDLPAEYVDAMLRQIVAFEMPIETLEGKFKLSQNRSKGEQLRVAEGLEREGAGDVAGVMRERKG